MKDFLPLQTRRSRSLLEIHDCVQVQVRGEIGWANLANIP